MDNTCRICRRNELKDCFSLNYQSDFHSQTGETVLEMLSFVTGLNAFLGDKLPQQLCRVCTATLVAGYELRNLCIESDTFFRKTLEAADHQKQPDQTDHNDAESCLIKLEVELEDTGNDCVETDMEYDVEAVAERIEDKRIDCEEKDLEYNVEQAVDWFYCCFPNCSVNYQFEELLTEHAESEHHLEREANASNCNDSEFRCNVCGRGFDDEVDLLQHQIEDSATLPSDSNRLLEKVAYGPNNETMVCSCGFSTNRMYSFNRHQEKCPQQYRHYRRPKHYADRLDNISGTDKTNDEIMALGFSCHRNTAMFYCCISQCATVCESQEQLCDHFEQLHRREREENMQGKSNLTNVHRCPICFGGFPTEKKLQIHLEDAYDPIFRCNTCRYSCPARKNAIAHARMRCGSKMHRCSCGYSTRYTFAIKRHMRTLGCPLEGSSLRQYRNRPTKTGEKDPIGSSSEMPYKCQNCAKSFHSIESLRRHTDSELSRALAEQEAKDPGEQIEGSEQKQYTCCWCETITDDTNHLVQCMIKAAKDSSEDVGHKCSNCNKTFQKYNKYVQHRNLRICLQKIRLACQTCGVKFPTRKILMKHMANVHKMKVQRAPNTKLHECKDCQRRFARAYTLNRHRRTLHNEEESGDESSESATLD